MKQTRTYSFDTEAQTKIANAFELTYKVAKVAYGPKAGNALLGSQQQWGTPLISRDGVTNIKQVYMDDEQEDQVAQAIKEASKQSNKKAGDGTTAATILGYHLYEEARKLVGSGHNKMEVSYQIEKSATKALEYIDSIKKPVTNELLNSIAKISANDEAIGEMVSDVVNAVGKDGGILVEDFSGVGCYPEIIDGFYFQRGFTDVRLINNKELLRAEYKKVPILLADKRISTITDIAPILQKATEKGIKELVIIGEVTEDAMITLLLSKAKGVIDTTVVDPALYSGNRTLFLEDIAIVTSGRIYTGEKDFSPEYFGMAEEVIITETSTVILGGDGDKDAIEGRVKQLREQLKEATSPVTVSALKDRLSKLTGKVGIIRVGAATAPEQKEIKLRVEDAVCAVQAAMREGIVPGGGVTLACVRGTDFDKAFQQPFKQLMDNAGLNPEERIAKINPKNPWSGFNLKNLTDEPVDLLKEGVIDPALVIKEVVRNASSIAAVLTTVGAIIATKEKE